MAVIQLRDESRKRTEFTDDIREVIGSYLDTIIDRLEATRSESGLDAARRLKDMLEYCPSTSQFLTACMVSQTVFFDEMARWKVMILDKKEAELLDDLHPFGEEVSRAFPSVNDDVLQATRCLALESPGACVFHLMRAVEKPLKCTLKLFSITGYDKKSWGIILREIEKQAWPNPGQGSNPDKEAFGRSVCGYISSVKKTRDSRLMHVDEPLPDMMVASKLYAHVKALMQHIAEHLDDAGNFR